MFTVHQNAFLTLLGLVLVLKFSTIYGVTDTDTCEITSFEDVSTIPECSKVILRNIVVPAGKTLEINLQDGATLWFDGVTKFEKELWHGPLISLKGHRVTVQSLSKDARLDGQGALYWDGKGEHSTTKPYFFHIEATDSVFDGINLLNCPMHCTDIANTNKTVFQNWKINNTAGQPGIAPKGQEGHNTDGFFIYMSHNVSVKNSVIINQDDCAVIRSGSGIVISNLHCTGSHGLSLSAGDSKTSVIENSIIDVIFEDSILVNADNAIHVKTHIDACPGEITGVIYRNITFSGISYYGIEIQQDYDGTTGDGTGVAKGNIPIKDLNMIDIQGTMTGNTSIPVYVFCAEGACSDWDWSNVSISGGAKANNCTAYQPTGFNC